MTTYTERRYDEDVRKSGFPYGKVILLLFLMLLVLFATLNTPLGRVATDSHAVERHGASEVTQIRVCLTKKGADMVWVKRDDPGVYVFCVNLRPDLACGRWGVLFAQFFPSIEHQCDYRELTSFVPKDGTYHRVLDYLKGFARRLQ